MRVVVRINPKHQGCQIEFPQKCIPADVIQQESVPLDFVDDPDMKPGRAAVLVDGKLVAIAMVNESEREDEREPQPSAF